jgi:hypothetical protein
MAAQLRARTPRAARRSVAAALLFLLSAALAGIAPRVAATEYRVFGIAEAVLALYLAWLLSDRRVWPRPRGITGWIAVVYGTVATAHVLHLLLPPPGALQWMVAPAVAVLAIAASALRTRRRIVSVLAAAAFLLAVLDYSVVPHLWRSLGPAAGTAFGLGDAAEAGRRLLVDYQPLRPGGELPGALAIAAWTLATAIAWPRRRRRTQAAARDDETVPMLVAAPSEVGRGGDVAADVTAHLEPHRRRDVTEPMAEPDRPSGG